MLSSQSKNSYTHTVNHRLESVYHQKSWKAQHQLHVPHHEKVHDTRQKPLNFIQNSNFIRK